MSCCQKFFGVSFTSSRNCVTVRMANCLRGSAQELNQSGYAEITARRHIRAAEHLIHWIGRKGRTVGALDDRMIEEFVQHLNRCRCLQYGRTHWRDLRNSARLFLRYVRFADLMTNRVVEAIIVDPALLLSFLWLDAPATRHL